MKTLATVLDSNQELSAHILGLDGWLLRTIPADRRNTFLRLYEKAVRTALHPDLIQDQNKKQFYDRYLGRVSESISAMCADAASYDELAEFVPAAKSKVVGLEQLLAERDAKIEELRAEIEAQRKAFLEEQKNFSAVEAARKNSDKRLRRSAAAAYEVFRQYKSLAENINVFSVNLKRFKVEGSLVRLDFTEEGVVETRLADCNLNKSRGTTTIPQHGKVVIVGAATLGGLKHCLETNEIPRAEMVDLLRTFSPTACDDRSLQLNHYLVGFFKPGMVLVVRNRGENLLIKVDNVDAIDEKSKRKILMLENKNAALLKTIKSLTKTPKHQNERTVKTNI